MILLIWTSYIEQMNKIVERMVHIQMEHIGVTQIRMRFRTSVDSFTDATEVSDAERLVTNYFLQLL